MILNVSGRTDIVAFYSDWFFNRLHDGYVDVRNPFYQKIVNRIYFKNVDAILFCTKNPLPILSRISEIKIPIIFHITITPYNKDIEPFVPDKKLIIEAVKKLSNILGKENVVVRYDPIFISEKYNLDYHVRAFDKLCKNLSGYVDKIIVSFLDEYKNTLKNKNYIKYRNFTENDYIINKKSKTIVVYFSRMGYTKKIAYMIASEENSNIYELTTKQKTSGTLGFWWRGRFNMHKWRMDTKDVNFNLKDYDKVIIVSPIWVFSLSAPIKDFCYKYKSDIDSYELVLNHFMKSNFLNVRDEVYKILGKKCEKFTSICVRFGKIKNVR